MDVTVKVDAGTVTMGLDALRLAIQQRDELMNVLGAGQLVSIRQTFADSGSPPGSWPPLSPNSLRWNKKYTAAGHKLLINSGVGLNSIGFTATPDAVTIGTNIFYMAIQQRGFDGTQNVRAYSYTRSVKGRDTFGRVSVTNKRGKQQNVRRKLASGVGFVNVKGFSRHISIPARRFLVFRPEDPQRIAVEVSTYVAERAKSAGFEVQ
jgi:phage gpG-like protein